MKQTILALALLLAAIVPAQGSPAHAVAFECDDAVDNDLDGATDYPEDPGCFSALDTAEITPECDDGVDNDADGWTDFPEDPGCSWEHGSAESPNPACSDGVDNDGDGEVDYPEDKHCKSIREWTEHARCRDTLDNDGDGDTDYPDDIDCDSPEEDSEADDTPSFLTIRYRSDRDRFTGRLFDDFDGDLCLGDRPIRLIKQKSGRDVVVGRDRTADSGRWSISNRRRSGRFYGMAPYHVRMRSTGEMIACNLERSDTVRLPRQP